jgi:GNAT superfamily N-acetyltransferase
MRAAPDLAVRRAVAADAETIGRLLHDFNSEFEEPTPSPRVVAERVRQLLAAGEITVLLGGTVPHGVAVLRFRPALWHQALDCYLEELYVVPQRRAQGLGRALMEAAIELAREKGAAHMDLGHQRGRRRCPRPLREPRLQQSRGQARRPDQLLLRTGALNEPCARRQHQPLAE